MVQLTTLYLLLMRWTSSVLLFQMMVQSTHHVMLYLRLTNNFTNNFNNSVSYGGAMYLYSSTTLSIFPYTTLHWENNHANLDMTLTPSFTALRFFRYYQKKNASSNSLVRVRLMVLSSNLFSRSTPLIVQEVCYLVV